MRSLAVGDAEFQKKCLGKMDEVSRKEGRTVLFVSHNHAAIRSLCTYGIVLRDGIASPKYDVVTALEHYVSERQKSQGCLLEPPGNFLTPPAHFSSIDVSLGAKQPNLILNCRAVVKLEPVGPLSFQSRS